MKFYCKQRYEGGDEPCENLSWRDKEYCWPHLISKRIISDEMSSWRGFLGVFCILGFVTRTASALTSLWKYLHTVRFEPLLGVFFSLSFSGLLLSLGMMMLPTFLRRLLSFPTHRNFDRIFQRACTFWPKLFGVSLALLTVFLIGFTIAGLAKPTYADFFISLWNPNLKMPHIVIVATTAAFGVWCALWFVNSILFVPIKRGVWYTVIALYFLVIAVEAFFSSKPFWSIFGLALMVAFLLEIKYQWSRKVLNLLRGETS